MASQNNEASLDCTLEYDIHDHVEDPSLPPNDNLHTQAQGANVDEQGEATLPDPCMSKDNEILSLEKDEQIKLDLNRIKSWDAGDQFALKHKKVDLGKRGLSDLSMHPTRESVGTLGSGRMKGALTEQERHYLTKAPPTKLELMASLEDSLTLSTATFASRSTIGSLNYGLSPNRNSSQSYPTHSPENMFSGSSGSEVFFAGTEVEFASQALEHSSSGLASIVEDSLSEEDYEDDDADADHPTGQNLAQVSSEDVGHEISTSCNDTVSDRNDQSGRVTRSQRRQRQISSTTGIKELHIMFSNKGDIDIHRYTNFVMQMGGTVVEHWEHCTHCVTTEIKRTRKLMCAFVSGKYIVSTDWLDESKRKKRLVDVDPYILCEPNTNEHPLKSREVYIAQSATVGKEDASELVKAAGGRILRYTPTQSQENIVVVTSTEDKSPETNELKKLGFTFMSTDEFLNSFLP